MPTQITWKIIPESFDTCIKFPQSKVPAIKHYMCQTLQASTYVLTSSSSLVASDACVRHGRGRHSLAARSLAKMLERIAMATVRKQLLSITLLSTQDGGRHSVSGKSIYRVCFSHPCMFPKVISVHLIVYSRIYWRHMLISRSVFWEKSGCLVFGILIVTDGLVDRNWLGFIDSNGQSW